MTSPCYLCEHRTQTCHGKDSECPFKARRDAFTAERQAKSEEKLFNRKCNDIIYGGIAVTQEKTAKRRTEQL